jgi:hypothetical protein
MRKYGNEWRKLRQIMHKMLMLKSTQSYKPIELLEAQQLSIDSMDDPAHFLMHDRRFTCSAMFNITYGRRLPQWNCKEAEDVLKDLDGFTSIQNPGEWLVDAFLQLPRARIFAGKLGAELENRGEEDTRTREAVVDGIVESTESRRGG